MSISPAEYYADPAVRRRIADFIGPDCGYLTSATTGTASAKQRRPVAELKNFLAEGAEITRSLWDQTSLIVDLDIEYVNFDRPAEVYLSPERTFAVQQPVQETITTLLGSWGIRPLHMLSGRGHHFVWRIEQDSRAFHRLVLLGRGAPSLWKRYENRTDESVPTLELARAYAGLSLVMEFVAARAKWLAAPRCEIPVELTAVEVGPSRQGREMISIDISEYGDPIESRALRVPFSVYLKAAEVSPLFLLPLQKLELDHALYVMRDPFATAMMARTAQTRIPPCEAGTEALLDAYEQSELKRFHDFFYSARADRPEQWPATYDSAPLDVVPACARLTLQQPNDLLLRPSSIRRLVRVFLALGWHPRHIAGLITSKYERDFQWTQFTGWDAATHAEFYVRLFAGQFMASGDDLVDFNCASAREQGLCFFENCHDNLLPFKTSALMRRDHDQLAHRPFNRLLPRAQHP